jgi:nucleotide-binding universal stress UspA family protein
MEGRMKVMIAYDGSAYADAALDDLRRAGVPREAEALIVSVGDGLVSVYSPLAEIAGTALTSRRVTSAAALAREQAVRLLAEARLFAARARGRVLSYFPEWEVRARVLEGSPAQELLRKAEEWGPNLIVVGSQGRSALGRLFLGSVSKSLATHARGPVRVGRHGVEKEDGGGPVRLVVGVDGSNGARWAVFAVATRAWPAGTEVRLVVVDDGNTFTRRADVWPRLEEMFTGGDEDPPINARLMAEGARVVLADAGLNASVEVREGDPRRVLVDEARGWAADSIFVGSHGLGSPGESAGLGGVASALVTDAACSVEVVRPDGPPGRTGGV